MQIYQSHLETGQEARGIALGFFDGLHRGHTELIRILLERCCQKGLPAAALTFDRHPGLVLNPDQPVFYLTSLAERLDLLAKAGLDQAHVLSFSQDFAALSPLEFLENIIWQRLNAQLLVVGPDYHFGQGGFGDGRFLQKWAIEKGIELIIVPEIRPDGSKISSSRIRELVEKGNVAKAAALLGRPFTVTGTVVSGRGLGRQLGFPTANIIQPAEKICPALGVYTSRAIIDGQAWPALTSIGLRPTVSPDEKTPVIETCIYDADLQLYGKEVTVQFLDWQRAEEKFASLPELTEQVQKDLELGRIWHQTSEQPFEKLKINDIPLVLLPSQRFGQAMLQLVFRLVVTPRLLASYALLLEVMTASCRRYPDRTGLALALDQLYGAEINAQPAKYGDMLVLTFTAQALAQAPDGSLPFADLLDLFFDMLLEPDLDQAGFFQEKIVTAERNNLLMTLAARANDPAQLAYDRCLAAFCPDQVHGLPVLGQAEDLAAISGQELLEAWQELLESAELTVYLAGSIQPEWLDACKIGLARLPVGRRQQLIPGCQPSFCPAAQKQELVEEKQVVQARLLLAYRGIWPLYSENSQINQLFVSMLGSDVHSLLFAEIREKMGLTYDVYAFAHPALAALFIEAGLEAADAARAKTAIEQQIERIASGDYPALLLERSRHMLRTRLLTKKDSLAALLGAHVRAGLAGLSFNEKEALAQLMAISGEQVNELAGRLQIKTSYLLRATQAEEGES